MARLRKQIISLVGGRKITTGDGATAAALLLSLSGHTDEE